MTKLEKTDKDIFDIIEREQQRQATTIELIASENFASKAVMEACGSVLTNKYAEGYPGRRYYGGCEFIDQAEVLANERLKLLFGATYTNVQPHSGSQANMAVLFSLLDPTDSVLGFDLSHGGHLTHGSSVNFSGKLYRSHFYGVDKETGKIDMNVVESIAREVRPKVIICGASAYSREWDYEGFRQVAESVGAILVADMAHPAGLIAAGLLDNPLEQCHIVTSTTHKTLRGPRGGIILMRGDFENPKGIKIKTKTSERVKLMSEVIDSEVMPGVQGGPLMHIIAAKAVSFRECLGQEFKLYAKQVRTNARAMASSFMKRGFNIVSGGTDNHLILIDLRNKGIDGKSAENILHSAGITTNKNMIPYDDKSPFITSGIRIGTAAITTRGMKESDVQQIVQFIDDVLTNANTSQCEEVIKRVKGDVASIMAQFALPS